ncbi:MAG: hypothetical protein JW776_15135 [Candidatus Lokiarchaeota archaeon]|nr:hypothetical protein [Candidatus Lokiarchaeota archaeon]
MKFRVVMKTKTRKGHDLVLKLKVPPSKHQGLVNFLNAALDSDNDVTFTIEKISSVQEHSESSIFGKFKFKKKSTKKEKSSNPSLSTTKK